MPNAQRLDLLRQLREQAGLSQEAAARHCGLSGRQSRLTVGAWERGDYAPDARRRTKLVGYLWDQLRLRQDVGRFEEVWQLLVEEWDWEPLSDREWQGLTSQPRPLAPTGQPSVAFQPFQAPPLTPYFVGRQGDLMQLSAQLTGDDGQVLALVGMGGVGKTTLATRLAHALRPHFADGVLWAEAAAGSPLAILQAWAGAYGHDLSEINDLSSRAAALRGILAAKHVLIVLDNVAAPETVRPLLPGTVSCAVLLTTRDQDSARILNARPYLVEEFSEAESLDLLATMLDAGRVAAEPEAARAICRLAHFLPLALEICAKLLARVSWQPLAALEQRLRDETRRLDQLSLKDLNVSAAFEVSWQTLSGEQRQLFTLLGVFAGRPFSGAALAYVAQRSEDETTDQLLDLVALSLVKAVARGVFQQHPLLADFAHSRLADPTAANGRFTEYYLHFSQAQRHTPVTLEGEFANVMRAMQMAFDGQQWPMVMGYADALAGSWEQRARFSEGRLAFAWGCSAARALGLNDALAGYLLEWGSLCIEQNDQEEAQRHWDEGLALAEQLGAPAYRAEAHYHLARLALERGQYEEVDERLTKALAIRQELDQPTGIAAILYLRAHLLHRVKQYEASNALCQEAFAIQEAQADISGALTTLRLLTDNALMQRAHEQAELYCQQAMQLAEQHNDRGELVKCYYNLATLYRRWQRYDEALAHAEQAHELFAQMGNRAFAGYALYEKSMIQKMIAAYAASLESGQLSLTILTELRDDYNQIFCLDHLGDLHRRMDQPEAARRLWSTALALAKPLHHPKTVDLETRLREL